ncbi:primase-helicase family protein [Gillisia sp. JM1]|uniref:primase-helicase family protein n=1 Tax=Gillisia sp. JM1 TaxID=1283286 RepID=UPI000406FF63|nr:primase-helicase family protein [Gillisia sp. JM1]
MVNRLDLKSYLHARDFVAQLEKENLVFWYYKKGSIHLKYYILIRFINKILGVYLVDIYGTKYMCEVTNNRIQLIEGTELSKLIVNYVEQYFPNSSNEFNRYDLLDIITETSNISLEKKALSFLPQITAPTKHDSKDYCNLFYQDRIIRITAYSVQSICYDKFDSMVFESSVLPRCYRRKLKRSRGEFKQFVWNISGSKKQRYMSLMAALGYLMHQYKDPANPRIIVLIDQIIGELETHNGGTGKSLLFGALAHMRNVVEISGKRKGSARFLMQSVNSFSDIIFVNDVGKYESIENWYNYASDKFIIEKKYKTEIVIPADQSPKICITTNHMIRRPEGNSSSRRLSEYEVSDYYGAQRNPQDEFGHSLFYDWDEVQWELFDDFMIDCVQLFLQNGLISPPKINIEKRKLLLEVGTELKEFLDEKMAQGQKKFHKKDTYDEFRKGGFISGKYLPMRNAFTRKVKKYMEYNHISYREIPSDSKLYVEIITEDTIEKESVKSLKDFDTDYKLVDTENKFNRMSNSLKI